MKMNSNEINVKTNSKYENGRSLSRVWVFSVILKRFFHILTGAMWAIRLP